ncbi:MAG: translation initiation factor IF-2 [Bacillota bacterium]|nr:translation initiation factor IF-2 [Bacillota bacterium]
MKVKDLAVELNINEQEVLEKAQAMNVEVSTSEDEMSEIDTKVVKNAIVRAAKKNETKVARRSSTKKVEVEKKEDEHKVTVKAANVKMPEKKKAPKKKDASKEINKETKASKSQPATSTKPAAKPASTRTVTKKVEGTGEMPNISTAMLEERIAKDNEAKAQAEATRSAEVKSAAEESSKVKEAKVEQAKEVKTVEEAPKNEPKKAAEGKTVSEPTKVEKEAPKAEEPKAEPAKTEEPKREKSRLKLKIVKKAEDVRREERESAEKRKREQKKAAEAEQSGKSSERSSKNSDKPNRSSDRQARNSDKANRSSDKPNRSKDNKAVRPRNNQQGPGAAAEAPTSGKASTHKKGKERDKDKDRDKFSKLERGGRKQGKYDQPKSLEKQERKKRHQNRPKVEEPAVPEIELEAGEVLINCPITVAGFVEQTKTTLSQAIMTLMKMGVMANQNQNLDEDTVQLLADEMGIKVVIGSVDEEEEYQEEEGIENFEDKEEDLKPRAPIITVMGHVDHGKTSLLDAIRNTNVTAGESGGITQHIGASEVEINGQKIVFLDTPGHEAFTAMRARGAHATDIAVLVVAADDSVKPQTIESISHAKAAGVPIIVAINKMDKPGANPDIVKKDLAEHNVLVEDWGGDVISVPVSAKTGEGITTLLEMILLQAEVLELKANPDRMAVGTVLEARLDKTKGPIASLLVLNGTLKSDMSVVAGTCSGKIRLMTNSKGEKLKKAGPATAVEILGLSDVPAAGDVFNAVKKSSQAKEIANNRQQKVRQEVLARNSSTTLEELFSQIQEGEVKELNLIVKADVQGSVGAIVSSLEKLSNDEVKVNVVHTGVGAINESDVMLAGTSGSIIIGFNVRPSITVTGMADRDGIQIRTYSVIYNILDDVENAMKGMLDPEYKEVVLGTVEIRDTFKVPNVGIIGGAYVTDGKVVRNESIRLVRDGIVIHEGKISSLKRFKDDAKEVAQGYECGIGIENYNDIKVGDVVECFTMEEIARN